VRHAADILARFRAFEVWRFDVVREHNPAFAYLFNRHRGAWLASAGAMRELLESPNIFVQILGLEMLAAGDGVAARRTAENLTALRALLYGRARKRTKRLVLQVLLAAATADPAAAGPILSLLAEAMDYHGRRAIADDLMAGYVRLRRQLDGRAATGGAQAMVAGV
jgi:hypothetical protein